MAPRVRGRNKWIWLLTSVWISCLPSPDAPVLINATTAQLQVREGITYLQNKPISGVVFSINTAGDTLFKVPFLDGKENGVARFFYSGKRLQAERLFVNGWKEGTHRGWYETGTPMFEYHFYNDLFEGSYKEWFPNGKLFRNMNYTKGQESGVQQSWYTTGKLKTNYIIKDDRRYGLLGTKHCKNVSDSIFKR